VAPPPDTRSRSDTRPRRPTPGPDA
jgi:hypothetical protein